MTQDDTVKKLNIFFDTIENEIVPKTKKGVAEGSKLFGAAVFRRSDCKLLHAATNNAKRSFVLHGEVNCIFEYDQLPADQKPAHNREAIFLCTHEPCSLCLSAITWAGFQEWYYMFSYQDSRDKFNIGGDIEIIEQVFGKKEPDLYERENKFWKSKSLRQLIDSLPAGTDKDKLEERLAKQYATYQQLSDTYQEVKPTDTDAFA